MQPHDASHADDLANLPPELLDLRDVARVCQLSARHVLRMVAAGRMPEPLRIGRCARWSRQTIQQWITTGCPTTQSSSIPSLVTPPRQQGPAAAGRSRHHNRTRPD